MISTGDFKIGNAEKTAIMDVLDSGRISEWRKVKEFENEWAKFVGTNYAITTNSGTSALVAGLTALKLSDHINEWQTKILTTPITYIATSNAIVTSGFEPVYVDVDSETFGITPDAIETHLEQVDDLSKYALILPVHLMGYPCDMDRINKIARKYGIRTFEDSAQAHGSTYKGQKTGSMSLMSTFSFYIAHNIQVGEMGAVNTNDEELAKLVRSIKANGRVCTCDVCNRNIGKCPYSHAEFDPKFTHINIGYNFKTMEFQAAIGLLQLKQFDENYRIRSHNVKYLNEGLECVSDRLQLPVYSDEVSYLGYPMIIKDKSIKRSELQSKLEERGIETRPMYGSIPTQQLSFKHLKEQYQTKLPNADNIGANGMFIGCHQYITQEELDYIIKTIEEVV
jgi:CDP-6-deoxy-D-xylo-4-hexulose-3-dehydrase